MASKGKFELVEIIDVDYEDDPRLTVSAIDPITGERDSETGTQSTEMVKEDGDWKIDESIS